MYRTQHESIRGPKINCTLLAFVRAAMPGKSSLFLRPRFHAKEPVLRRTMVAVYRTGFHLSIYCIAPASTLPLRMLLWRPDNPRHEQYMTTLDYRVFDSGTKI